METLSKRIFNLRKQKGLTQTELGDFLGVTKQTISKYERDIKVPSRDAIQKLADIFNVTTDFLLGRNTFPNLTQQEDIKLTKSAQNILERINELPLEKQQKAWEHLEMFINYENLKRNS